MVCPVEASRNTAVRIEEGLGKAVCEDCLNNGGCPTKGIGIKYLKKYSIFIYGDYLIVQN
jgi:hypothetical protein